MNVPAPDRDPDLYKEYDVGLSAVQEPVDVRVNRAAADGASQPMSLDDNDPTPGSVLKKFKPHHYLMAYMAASGRTYREIAAVLGVSYSNVQNVLAQPLMRDEMRRIATELGRDIVDQVLQGEVLPSIRTLIEVRDATRETKPQVAIAAANSLLDRYLGKPTQRVESTNFDGGAIEESVEAKRAELARINDQMRAQGVSIVPGDN